MTRSDERALSPLAAELRRIVALSRGKRIPVAELFDAATKYDPALVGDPDARSRFRNALAELENTMIVTMPSRASRVGWDARVLPLLPAWVQRADLAPLTPRTAPAARVWPSVLEAAGRLATRPDEHELLERIAAWIRDNPAPGSVPAEERSLELFDDEKALDGYLKTRLFTSGALTMDLLFCYSTPIPFASQHVAGTAPSALLVVENLATYTSFLTALRELSPGARPDLHIGWGVGGAFEQSVLSIPLLEPAPKHLFYFGDLDVAGLRIAAGAARNASDAGLPELRPVAACYQFLLNGPQHWRRSDSSNRNAQADYQDTCRWLPAPLDTHVSKLFSAGLRVPQERLGLQALRRFPTLLTELTSLERRWCFWTQSRRMINNLERR